MCKSQAEGGQRCAGHARERRAALLAKWDDNLDALEDGSITRADWDAYQSQVDDAIVDYVSTPDGAAEQRALLSRYEAALETAVDDDHRIYLDSIATTRNLIDQGAMRAQTNREVENAYRATQGKPPLTTPVPQTVAQEQAAALQVAAQAERQRTWASDPLGLRAAARTEDDMYRRLYPQPAAAAVAGATSGATAQVFDGTLDSDAITAQIAQAVATVDAAVGQRQAAQTSASPTPGTKPCGCLPAEAGGTLCATHADDAVAAQLEAVGEPTNPAARMRVGFVGILAASQHPNSPMAAQVGWDLHRKHVTTEGLATPQAKEAADSYVAYQALRDLGVREQAEAEDAYRAQHGLPPKHASLPPMANREAAQAVRDYFQKMATTSSNLGLIWTGVRSQGVRRHLKQLTTQYRG